MRGKIIAHWNHLADWTILVPFFYANKLWHWLVNRACHNGTGGSYYGNNYLEISGFLGLVRFVEAEQVFDDPKAKEELEDPE